MGQTFLSSYGHDHTTVPRVDLLLVYSQIRVLGAPVSALDGQFGEVDFVKIYDSPAFAYGLSQFLKLCSAVLGVVGSETSRKILLLTNLLPLDLVLLVEAPERSWSNSFVGKSAMKQLAALFDGATSPNLQGFGVDEKLTVFL